MLSKAKSKPHFGIVFSKRDADGTQGLVGGSVAEGLKGAGWENPLALALATGGSMATVGTPIAMRNAPARIVNQATSKVTPQQFNEAQDLVRESYRLGTPITGAEALAKVTGASPMTGIQRIIENAPNSSETMSEFMSKRPAAQRVVICRQPDTGR